MKQGEWVKSSACDNSGGSCVKVMDDHGRIHVRDDGGVIACYTYDEWDAFIDAVKRGEFDRG